MRCSEQSVQKKVVYDSPGLVDFAIGRVNSVFNLSAGANDVFWGNNLNNRRTVKSLLLVNKILQPVEMMSGLVNASFSLPKWQMCAETFLKKLSSQDTGNGFPEHQDFKIFYGKKPSDPRSGSPSWQTCDSLMIKKYPDFTYSKGWTVCITMCI